MLAITPQIETQSRQTAKHGRSPLLEVARQDPHTREVGGFEDTLSALAGALVWLLFSYVSAQAELLSWPTAILAGALAGLGVQWLLACPLRLLLTCLPVVLPLLVVGAVLAVLL